MTVAKIASLPLAAAHSDITFILTTGARQHAACVEKPACATPQDAAGEMGHVIARHHEETSSGSIATSVIMNILIPGGRLQLA